MKRVLVLTEGQTEEGFIKQVLQPHLWPHGVSLEPKIVTTKRVIGGADIKGGGDAGKLLADVRRLLGDSNAVAVTTFFDFYGFPPKLPGADEQAYKNIDALTVAFNAAVANRRFAAYLQRHEFESLLFVDTEITSQVANRIDAAEDLRAQRSQFDTPEDINLDPSLAPSKRLTAAFGRYSKPLVGATAAQRIGIEMRVQKPR